MKIISNFHDIYDVMCMYGVDDNITFERVNRHGINTQHHPIVFPKNLLNEPIKVPSNVDIMPEHGALYDRLETYLGRSRHNTGVLHAVTAVINAKAYKTFIWEENGVFNKNLNLRDMYDIFIKQDIYMANFVRKSGFEEWLNSKDYFAVKDHSVMDWTDRWNQIHKDVQSPVFFVYDGRVFKDLPLHYFGFDDLSEKIEMLFQDIMYCQGNIVQNNNEPPIAVDDKTKISQAGFDVITSFRGK